MLRHAGLTIVAVSLLVTGVAQAVQIEKYEADFTSWTGQDMTATSPVTSSTGHTPVGGFYISYPAPGNVLPDGCLTQGSISGVPTTAKFSLATGGTRARLSAPLPTSMKGTDGLLVEWSARYGSYDMKRAPVQIAFFEDGGSGNKYDAFFQVDNGNTLRIQRNGGTNYTIDALTIPNLGDTFHAWSAEVIVSEGYAYWDLKLDGNQLLFTGTGSSGSGSPVLGDRTYSFRTITINSSSPFTPIPDQVGGTGSYGYVGLGELDTTAAQWDFEFDYVRFQNLPEPASLLLMAIGLPLLARKRGK